MEWEWDTVSVLANRPLQETTPHLKLHGQLNTTLFLNLLLDIPVEQESQVEGVGGVEGEGPGPQNQTHPLPPPPSERTWQSVLSAEPARSPTH